MMRHWVWLLISTAAFSQSIDPKERALGKAMAADFEQRVQILSDRIVTAYVQKLAGSLASLPIEVKVVDSPQHSAAAFPGGFLFVSTGLIATAKSEAEFAQLLAHQIAHIVNQRGRTLVIAGESGLCARFGENLVPLGLRKERDALELEMDQLAVGYMAGFRSSGGEFERVRATLPVRPAPSLRNPN